MASIVGQEGLNTEVGESNDTFERKEKESDP